ncbi:MAG TPA: hypothetical protein VJB57_03220, partial [Dehalococcoidia bacterium]|nr:hypothetical protein [Dehalococcoidia bacterium]
ALSSPDVVQSLLLLEPALLISDSAQGYRDSLLHVVEEYESGNVVALVDGVWQARFGANYRSFLDRALPGGFDEAVANAEAAVRIDMPSLIEWSFTEEKARRVLQPTLSVLGADSPALWSRFQETHDALLRWLPNCEGFVLPRATHALQIQNPRDMARAMAAFLARHPIDTA